MTLEKSSITTGIEMRGTDSTLNWNCTLLKAMDDIGVVMTPFGDVVTVSLVANNYVVGFYPLNSGVVEVY